MNSLFLILSMLSIVALIIGVVKPSVIKMKSRKQAVMVTVISTIAFFVLFGLTAPELNDEGKMVEVSKDKDEIEEVPQEEPEKEKSHEDIEKEKKEQEKEKADAEAEKMRKEAEEEKALKKKAEEEKKAEAEKKAAEEASKVPKETLSQQNAVRMANSYIDYDAFSKSGLVEQLKYEGFSNEDATYAVDKIQVDWQEQAVMMAENYLDYDSFSRSGLIEQLKYEGFSGEQATNAVNEIGL